MTHTWAGEFDSLRKEQKRLAFIIPISLAIIVVLLYMQFGTWKDAFIVIATLSFRGSWGHGFLVRQSNTIQYLCRGRLHSLIGVATLGAVVFMSGVRRAQRECRRYGPRTRLR